MGYRGARRPLADLIAEPWAVSTQSTIASMARAAASADASWAVARSSSVRTIGRIACNMPPHAHNGAWRENGTRKMLEAVRRPLATTLATHAPAAAPITPFSVQPLGYCHEFFRHFRERCTIPAWTGDGQAVSRICMRL